jgi:hypothetical protein
MSFFSSAFLMMLTDWETADDVSTTDTLFTL